MFREATAFNRQLTFDTASVTSMHAMFYNAGAHNHPLAFDVGSATDMGNIMIGPALSALLLGAAVRRPRIEPDHRSPPCPHLLPRI